MTRSEPDPPAAHRSTVHLRTAGLCVICGQEQLRRIDLVMGDGSGLSMRLEEWTDCACGVKRVGEDQ